MSGQYATLPNYPSLTGAEVFPFDTELAAGAQPLTAIASALQLATAFQQLTQVSSITTVAGTRYIVGPFTIGAPGSPATEGIVNLSAGQLLNGVRVLVGSTGGTDGWIAELHSSTGALLATSNTAGVTAGATGTWMNLPFYASGANTPYAAAPGTYYIAIQSNGTTAKIGAYGAASLPIVTGTATGTFGTGASITPPTTFTTGVGPQALLY